MADCLCNSNTAPEWAVKMQENITKKIDESLAIKLKQLNDTNKKQDKQIDILKNYIKSIDARLKSVEAENVNLKNHLLKNETYSRRDNLIFKGLGVTTNANCEAVVKSVCRDIGVQNADNLQFQRCHKLNKFPTGPVIARFEHYKDRDNVWNKKNRLPKSKYICEDFPISVEKNRRVLFPIFAKSQRSVHYKNRVKLKMDTIIYDNTTYDVNSVSKLPVDINPRWISEISTNDKLVFGGLCSIYHPFSNFYKCKIVADGITFNCLEQIYQFKKALYFEDKDSAELILSECDPSDQKRIGRRIKQFSEEKWMLARDRIMYDLVTAKLGQNKDIVKALLDTENKEIIECNRHDAYWGTGIRFGEHALNKNNWKNGTNQLGQMLMKSRDALRSPDIQNF